MWVLVGGGLVYPRFPQGWGTPAPSRVRPCPAVMLWGSQGTGRAGGPEELGVPRVAPKFSVEPIHSPLFPGQCRGWWQLPVPQSLARGNISAWIQLMTKEQWNHSGMTLREPG